MGGHCISVDPWFLVGDYPSLAKVIDESMKTNDGQPAFVLNRIHEIMKEKGIKDTRRVGLYGLTYKENVDDVRESPTLQLLECQERHLAEPLKVYDPLVGKDIVPNQYHDLDAFLADVDLVVSATGFGAAKVLYERFGIPYAVGSPVGSELPGLMADNIIMKVKEFAEAKEKCYYLK